MEGPVNKQTKIHTNLATERIKVSHLCLLVVEVKTRSTGRDKEDLPIYRSPEVAINSFMVCISNEKLNSTINLVGMKNEHFISRFSASIYATSCDARKDQNSFKVKSTSLV